MASRATLKTYFETGDRPSQGQFEAFLDSVLIQDNSEDYLRKSGAEMLFASTEFQQMVGYLQSVEVLTEARLEELTRDATRAEAYSAE